jgi:uncharacterized protein
VRSSAPLFVLCLQMQKAYGRKRSRAPHFKRFAQTIKVDQNEGQKQMSATILITKVRVSKQSEEIFTSWQTELNQKLASSQGFVSLEILPPIHSDLRWFLFQRFSSEEDLNSWRKSPVRSQLIAKLKGLLKEEQHAIEEEVSDSDRFQGGVTEVFITQVDPQHYETYRQWIAKIQQTEALFPGYRGVYVQPPSKQGKCWITMLQFDTSEHLDNWLKSVERQAILQEASQLISSLESHRVISAYAGWFSTEGEAPPAWKQAAVVLLVLFPIVMLEIQYLSPLIDSWNLSIATFVSNAISVALLTWPLMPIANYFLSWWLLPQQNKAIKTMAGVALMLLLYLLEILIFWK